MDIGKGFQKEGWGIKRKKAIAIFFFAIIFSALLAVFAYTNLSVYRVDVFDAIVFVDYSINGAGINTDTDKLNFGRLRPGQSGSRFLNLDATDYPEDLEVSVAVEGEIGKMVRQPKDFVLRAGFVTKLELLVQPPEGIKQGNYTGKVVVTYTLE